VAEALPGAPVEREDPVVASAAILEQVTAIVGHVRTRPAGLSRRTDGNRFPQAGLAADPRMASVEYTAGLFRPSCGDLDEKGASAPTQPLTSVRRNVALGWRECGTGARAVTANDLLDGHVALDIQSFDRIYLNAYIRSCSDGARHGHASTRMGLSPAVGAYRLGGWTTSSDRI
jgi:hypothetical protein